MHATLRIGDSSVMIGNASEHARAMPAMLYVYVPNVDEVYAAALKAGGTSIMPPTDMFYGDRHGGVTDPGGNQWYIATHIEDVGDDELQARADKMMGKARPANRHRRKHLSLNLSAVDDISFLRYGPYNAVGG